MSIFPLDTGPVHFVGIGGIGMSGIAEVMHNLGHEVRGTDVAENANVKRLRSLGIPIRIGHAPENLAEAQVVVTSSAIQPDNPEIVHALERRIPVIRRAEMLAELMRYRPSIAIGGTHGKTTTTSLAAAVLAAGGLDPTVINGGVINAYDTNARLGTGPWMVVEADESDGSLVRLPATVAVLTNVDPEHLDHYGSLGALHETFREFIVNIPFYGVGIVCADHPEVRRIADSVHDRRIVTYGFESDADIRADEVRYQGDRMVFDVRVRPSALPGVAKSGIPGVQLRMPGLHSVQNALAATAVGLLLGVRETGVRDAFRDFKGVRRRFTCVGVTNGVTVIDDYAHHPVEIRAVLQTARTLSNGRVIAVLQPHRYSRLRDLFDGFCSAFGDADEVIVTEVYAAGEAPLKGVDRDALVAGIVGAGHQGAKALGSREALAPALASFVRPGDMVICLGAGDITHWAAALPGELASLTRGVAA